LRQYLHRYLAPVEARAKIGLLRTVPLL